MLGSVCTISSYIFCAVVVQFLLCVTIVGAPTALRLEPVKFLKYLLEICVWRKIAGNIQIR